MEEMTRVMKEKEEQLNPDERPLNVGIRSNENWEVDPTNMQKGRPGVGLPLPEGMSNDDKSRLEVVVLVFGEELAKCSVSHNRALREYALMQSAEQLPELEPTTDSLTAISVLVHGATSEKVPLVFECGMRLCRLGIDSHAGLPSQQLSSDFEPVVKGLMHRIDSREPHNAASKHVFNHACDSLLFLSKREALKSSIAKYASGPIPENTDDEKFALTISGRLELLASLFSQPIPGEESTLLIPGDVKMEDLTPWLKEGLKNEKQGVWDTTRDFLVEVGNQIEGSKWENFISDLTHGQQAEVEGAVKKSKQMKAQLAQMRQLTK